MPPLAVPRASKTVKLEDTTNEPVVALMFVCPEPTLIASPVALIVATEGEEELQTTVLVTSSVVPFRKVPVAVNC